MKCFLAWTTAAGAALLIAFSLASAQERRESGQDKKSIRDSAQKTVRDARDAATQTGRDQADRGRGQSDQPLVTWLATDNEGEIEVAKFVAQRAQSDEVKKFAQRMVDEHTDFLNKLRRMGPLASTGSAQEKSTVRTEDQKRPADTTRRPETAQRRPDEDTTIRRGYLGPDGRVDLAHIKQEIGKQCVETLKKELGEKSGDELDKCYMGQQILAHLEMADTLKVMKNYASSELKQLIADGEKATHAHLDEAKDILNRLEGKSGKREGSKDNK